MSVTWCTALYSTVLYRSSPCCRVLPTAHKLMENTLEYQTQYKKTFACWEEFNREQAKLTQLGVDFFLNDEARKSDLCDNLEGERDRPKGGREGGREGTDP